jgi:hypothetical protein
MPIGGLKALYNLILKDAIRGSGGASGIMSIGDSVRALAQKRFQSYVMSAQKQGVDLDKFSEGQLKYMLEMNKAGNKVKMKQAPSIKKDNVIEGKFGKSFKEEIEDMDKKPEDMADGGRAGFSKGKIVKEGLEGLAQLLKKEKARTQRISGNLRAENSQRVDIGEPKLDQDEYDYYREILGEDGEYDYYPVKGDETKEFLEAMVKEQEAEMAYMKRLYDKGALNPTAGETTMGRLKMLEDKAQRGESLSAEEIAEIKRLSEIFNKAQGGRIGFKKGMDRRTFMKIMGGLTALPVVGKFFKGAEVAAPVVEKAVDVASGAPPYFFNLVDRIRALGKKFAGPKERSESYSYKDYEMDIDLDTGKIDIKKTKEAMIPGGDEAGIAEEVYMTYKPGVADETTKGRKVVDEYEEFTARPDIDGKMKDVEDGVPDEVVREGSIGKEELEQEIIEQVAREKKASGGLAYMLGE